VGGLYLVNYSTHLRFYQWRSNSK